MDMLTRVYVGMREAKGQTMAEYALIMAAIAVVCIVAYNALGGAIITQVAAVTAAL